MALKRGQLLGWWYVCIGVGFIALGARALIAGVHTWPVAIRFVIALGFLILGVMSLRSKEI
ncbi:MAG TPA: hypothetical protein VKG25_06390 [Bryobacteraceae bacterium]|nr:hypothetical protein [Bryobacteraceae bacterium]